MTARRAKVSESAIAEVVIGYLHALGADVYQEVACSGGYADIVAKFGPEIWIVETKTSFSLALIYQAMERRRAAHRVFIAAPYTRHLYDLRAICDELGVGLLVVRMPDEYSTGGVDERCGSRRWNSRPVALAERLRPEHKTHAKAGTAGGGRYTPFLNTCRQLVQIVNETPGIPVKEAVDKIRHHYASSASARSSLASWVKAGKVEGVRLAHGPGVMRLYPTESK